MTLGTGAVKVVFTVVSAAVFGLVVFAFVVVARRGDVLGVAAVLIGVLAVIFSLIVTCLATI
ncbi:MAG: hypothetical protein JKY94_05770 [Rhodobacteraceae bacterium]|nr:hypothetical protein [Paracoccaceae bacterium]